MIIVKLFSEGKGKSALVLEGIDTKNKDHQLILQNALMTRDMFGYTIYSGDSRLKTFLINWRLRKKYYKISHINRTKKINLNASIINFPKFVEIIYQGAKSFYQTEDIPKLAEIYTTYYERN